MNDFPPGKSDHRNQQKNYINIINLLREQNKAGDWHLLSEKFKILKLQAQFQHWNEQAVIAQFATMKDQVNGILRKHFFPTHCEVSQKGIPRNQSKVSIAKPNTFSLLKEYKMHFISKCFVLDVKSYHTYLFVDMYLDQTFVNDVLRKMLEHRDFERNNTLVIESDNCFPQCKYAGHSFIPS